MRPLDLLASWDYLRQNIKQFLSKDSNRPLVVEFHKEVPVMNGPEAPAYMPASAAYRRQAPMPPGPRAASSNSSGYNRAPMQNQFNSTPRPHMSEDNPFQDPVNGSLPSAYRESLTTDTAAMSIGGMEAVQPPRSAPPTVGSMESDETIQAITKSERRQQTAETIHTVYDGIKTEIMALETPELMIMRLERTADSTYRRSYVDGNQVREIIPDAPVLNVGICFLPGSDKTRVTLLESTNMSSKMADQMNSMWRVDTAGRLLFDFEVTSDLSIIRHDKTIDYARTARDRLSQRYPISFPPPAPPEWLRGRGTVTIDSDHVKMVQDLRLHQGQFDLESTLIEVDGHAMMNVIVKYRLLTQQGGAAENFNDAKDLLESMMEDVRRLCEKSPLLFRMATRPHITMSKDTRYGVNHGRHFTTLATSESIRKILLLSNAVYKILDEDEKAQKFIRPKFLQMFTLLLSFLNDRDLSEIKDFTESTYGIKADRKSVELLCLKVLPLLSINSKVFLKALIPTFEGAQGAPKDPENYQFSAYWDTFLTHILQLGYFLPGNSECHGRANRSWVVEWPAEGFKSSEVFANLQFAGPANLLRFNEIPRFQTMIQQDEDTSELTIQLTNDEKYSIRAVDYERISCLMQGNHLYWKKLSAR
ncbi:hypothetical protein BT63DRAFT_229370 [Microthyrium microscopicum]|uniref:Uncharacterized protein n=1 Tax=Microthyrium microscopicum TaxID=703497 RepID=A0A6A6UCV9_9PEZI|nr:hypothetical protein BT63DRAFT_229370 [Microthyrium microscopicum]